MKIAKILFASAMILSICITGSEAATVKGGAVLAEVEGTVEVKPSTSKAVWVAGVANTALVVGDLIRTGKDSYATIHINQDAETINIELKSQSQLELVELSTNTATGRKKTILSLGAGEAMFKTKNMGADSKFEVKTPTSVIEPQGSKSVFSAQVEHAE